LLDLVWPGLVVEENNLQVHVSTLRKVLGPAVIATIPGRGYRFTPSLDGAGAGRLVWARISLGSGVFLITALAVVLITLLTISFQTIKAAVASPVKSLRSE